MCCTPGFASSDEVKNLRILSALMTSRLTYVGLSVYHAWMDADECGAGCPDDFFRKIILDRIILLCISTEASNMAESFPQGRIRGFRVLTCYFFLTSSVFPEISSQPIRIPLLWVTDKESGARNQ